MFPLIKADDSGPTGRWCLRKPLLCGVFLLMVGITTGHHSSRGRSECSEKEFWRDGLCCDRCAPGYKLVKKCSVGVPTECVKCSEGTYQDRMNYYPNCFRCKECSSRNHLEVVSPCSQESNTVCRCQEGYRKKILDSITWTCVPHKKRHSNLQLWGKL